MAEVYAGRPGLRDIEMEDARMPPTAPVPRRTAIEAVIFDFGNVLCTFDNRRILAGLAPLCGLRPEELARRIEGSDLPRAYESGEIDSQAFLAGLSGLCGHPFAEAAFVRTFSDIFTPIEPTWQLVRALKPRYRLGLLSNTNPWHFEHGIRPTAVFPLFDAVTLSYEVGAMKPDPRIYADAVAKLALPPGACAFIDDLPENVEGARAAGLQGIHYTGPEALAAELRHLGIVV